MKSSTQDDAEGKAENIDGKVQETIAEIKAVVGK